MFLVWVFWGVLLVWVGVLLFFGCEFMRALQHAQNFEGSNLEKPPILCHISPKRNVKRDKKGLEKCLCELVGAVLCSKSKNLKREPTPFHEHPLRGALRFETFAFL